MTTTERRVFRCGRVTLRAASAEAPAIISGLGAVYNREAVIGGWFRERIAPGAFAPAIGSDADIRSLFNHDPNRVLGRTAAGTLRLRDADDGLNYEVDVNPDDPDAMSVAAKIKRGDVTGSSFGFVVGEDDWQDGEDCAACGGSGRMGDVNAPETCAACGGTGGSLPLRTIRSFAAVDDIGPVTFPAYDDTTSSARSKASEIRSKRREARDVPANVSTKKADPSTSWSAPTLADFTKDAWGDLTAVERNHIAGHFAWRAGDSYGDLHLPHHRPADGAVVLRGVIAAAGRLDQLAGGDTAAIRAHLEAHYHQFDLKAPWEDDSKAAQEAVERRLRQGDDDRARRLRFAIATR